MLNKILVMALLASGQALSSGLEARSFESILIDEMVDSPPLDETALEPSDGGYPAPVEEVNDGKVDYTRLRRELVFVPLTDDVQNRQPFPNCIYIGTSPRNPDRKYVLKVVDFRRKGAKARFREEIDALQQLQHPRIIMLLWQEIGKRAGELLCPYQSGDDLFFHIKNNYREESYFDSCKIVGREIAEALKYMHEKDFVHRDIKPENVLFTDKTRRHILLIDLGFAKQIKLGEWSTSYVGTLFYTAPEILLKKKHNRYCDYWSFGVMLYAMYTQTFPFSGMNDREICNAIFSKDPPNLWRIPAKLKPFLLRLLNKKDPDARAGDLDGAWFD